MATGSTGVVGSAGAGALDSTSATGTASTVGSLGPIKGQKGAAAAAGGLSNQAPQPKSGQGAQFIYVAATVANILCDNLTQTQINLLANFLSVVTTCVYAILTVENPTDIIEA